MRKVKVLIVEDQIVVAKDIAHYISEIGCEVIGILMEGEEVAPFLNQEKPDLILMDITLKGDMDGIQAVKLLKENHDIPIIYLTANTDDRSFKEAKETAPFGFIEKPFKPKRLKRTVQLLIAQIAENTDTSKEESDDNQFILSDRIFVKEKGRMTKIFLADILYVEADGAYSKIVTANKEYLLAVNLRNLEEKISSEELMRVHRSYIVNLKNIDVIEDKYISIHKKGIPVSRSHWDTFLKRVNVI